ncbi:GNAT family N-acetyltransferase [Aeromicrobium sp. CF4.19]|uniref:GNAT family N-acetyltransferase n=1 Tax=Aeromicrobium sp. CF4.19 TaxID=3373082 RepID=UPI003EE655AF
MVRRRDDEDAGALLAALQPVHVQDGYPLHDVHLTPAWLYDGLDEAWVAELDHRLVGHVALAPAEGCWHLTRFFVAVDARGTGAGSALLATVEAWADERDVELALDVVEHNSDAQALYEHRGWERTGTVTATWVSEQGPWPQAYTYRRHVRTP